MIRVVLAASLALVGTAHAQVCVDRTKFQADHARDAKLDGGKLVFCTSDKCWSMDPATRAFTAIKTIPKAKKRDDFSVDPTGRATATTTGVELCPKTKGVDCKKYSYKFKYDGTQYAMINAEGTLGAVMYQGDSMEGQPSWTIIYDLSKPKEVKRFKTEVVSVFGKTFWIDDAFYDAAGKKLAKLKRVSGEEPVRVGMTDIVAASDKFTSKLFLIDTAAGKLAATVPLNLAAGASEVIDEYLLVPSADGKQVHVIAGAPNSGEVITVDVATGKEVARSSPPICAGANVTKIVRKPAHVAKQWVLGQEVVQVSKDKPLVYYKSANAKPAACDKFQTQGVITAQTDHATLMECIRGELGKKLLADKEIDKASSDAALTVAMASVDKQFQQPLLDAAKGAKIIGITYGKEGMSTLHIAVAADGRITAVWINSNEI